MKKQLLNYETMLKVTKAISHSKNPEEGVLMTVESIKTALDVKGCTVFLINRKTNDLEVAASYGLSDVYLNKGPLDAEKSIVDSLHGKTVLVPDAAHDDRIQYPKEAELEKISSILSVPIQVKWNIIGVLRLYTEKIREFTEEEMEFITALADMGGIAIENARLYDHLKMDYEKLMNDVHHWFDYGSM